MLWVKTFHIVFVVSWFAGLLYLPRLFVYHRQCDADEHRALARFETMERKLFVLMTVAGVGTTVFGLWLLRWFGAAFTGGGWLHAKLLLVAVLVAFHLWCWKQVRDFRLGQNRHSERFFRLINEAPALLLIAVVALVVVKPF